MALKCSASVAWCNHKCMAKALEYNVVSLQALAVKQCLLQVLKESQAIIYNEGTSKEKGNDYQRTPFMAM